MSKAQEKVKELSSKLESGIDMLFNRDDFKAYLNKMTAFHAYSFQNTFLIFSQCPNATKVAGFKQWQKMNRNVKKGEKAIKIFVPYIYKKKDKDNDKSFIVNDADTTKNKDDDTYISFGVGSVFDYSQTEGETIIYDRFEENVGSIKEYKSLFGMLVAISPVPVSVAKIDNKSCKGFYSPSENTITISDSISEIEVVKTLIHEITHSVLHNKLSIALTENKSKKVKETEAEGVAYIISNYLGIDDSEDSFSYISEWSKDKDTFTKCLATIQKTAHTFIEKIEKYKEGAVSDV